jgi:peptidoglycan hydrolase CwlO-like protein
MLQYIARQAYYVSMSVSLKPQQLRIFLVIVLTLISLFFVPAISMVHADTNDNHQKELEDKIKEYENKISDLHNQSDTLASQIEIANSQITLTELKIKSTQSQIAELAKEVTATKNRINGLEGTIAHMTQLMIARVTESYALSKINPVQMLLTTNNIDNFLTRLRYIEIVQDYDKRSIYAAQTSKNNYESEKDDLEVKQKQAEVLGTQLESFTTQLETEKKAKQDLLSVTQNNEKQYQKMLSEAKAEYEAIQQILAGNGQEKELGHVNEGDTIAHIIQGASCNSSGTHLHFTVTQSSNAQNPFNFLSGTSDTDYSHGDSFSPSGGWRWPIDSPILFYQGYGETWSSKNSWVNQIYSFHNGIDIGTSGSQDVHAVKSGNLTRGSYTGEDGCTLPYARVDHDEGGYSTLYLHTF